MTEEAMEQVREKTVPIIRKLRDDTMNAVEKQEYLPEIYPVIRAILSIPEILIKDPDQSLPKSSFLVSMYESMLKPDKNGAVWVKVMPKEEK